MANFTLGLVLETLGLRIKAAIERAASLGAQAVQIDAAGDLRPEVLSDTGKRELRVKLQSHNLKLSAVQIPLRHGLDATEYQEQLIEHVRKTMSFAIELGANLVVVPFPKLVGDGPRTNNLKESLLALGSFGDHIGVRIALETGLDPGSAVTDFLTTIDCGLGVTYDPANFLANGHDPLKALSHLAGVVLHVQARDLRTGTLSSGPKEVVVGAGEIDWMTTMATLDAIGYRGALVVDREEGSQRAIDAANGLQFLRRFVPKSDFP